MSDKAGCPHPSRLCLGGSFPNNWQLPCYDLPHLIQLNPYQRILYTKTVVVLGFAAGFSLSPKLWVSTRFYPLIPVFHGLPRIPYPLDYLLFGLLFLLLALAGMSLKPRAAMIGFTALLLILACCDQTRWQPWAYLYLFMLLSLACFSWNADDFAGTANSLNICRLIVVATYFYSGLQKMNTRFAAGVFSLLGREASHHFLFTMLGYALAAIETLIAIGLVTRKYRKIAVIAGVCMHLFILFSCIFIYRWNSVVWPWNIAMIVLLVLLFWRSDTTPIAILWRNPIRLQKVVLVLFGILPSLSFFGLWDSYLSASLYSANVPVGNILIGEAVKAELPAAIQRRVTTIPDGDVLRIQDWSLAELNVPPYPAMRAYRTVAADVCRYSHNSPDVMLIVHEKDTLLGKGALVRDTCFGTLMVNRW